MLCHNCMREISTAVYCPHCNSFPVVESELHHVKAGTVLKNRYVVGKVLGEGGFGITYIGYDTVLEKRVAIKEYFISNYSYRNNSVNNNITISISQNKDLYEYGKNRFLYEARVLAKFFNNNGVVNVNDFIEENNTAYIVMEYIEGVDLRRYLTENGVISCERAIGLFMPIMKNLVKIHESGIIHRDISPDNIMYLDDGTLKLTDFGSAREYEEEHSISIILKRGYSPEEQYRRNGEQGPWTDVYGICATIYRCITGKTPEEALSRMIEDTLKRPSYYGVNISAELENVLMYGLAIHKKDRCPDMDTLIRMFESAMTSSVTQKANNKYDKENNLAVDQYNHNEIYDMNTIAMSFSEKENNDISRDAVVVNKRKNCRISPWIVGVISFILVVSIVLGILYIVGMFDNKGIDGKKDKKKQSNSHYESVNYFLIPGNDKITNEFESLVNHTYINVNLDGYDTTLDYQCRKDSDGAPIYYYQEWKNDTDVDNNLERSIDIAGNIELVVNRTTVSELLNEGYVYKDAANVNKTVEPSVKVNSITLVYNGSEITVGVYNNTGVTTHIDQCVIWDIYVNNDNGIYNDYMGISSSVALDELQKIMGQPKSRVVMITDEDDSALWCTYSDEKNDIKFSFQYGYDSESNTFSPMCITIWSISVSENS